MSLVRRVLADPLLALALLVAANSVGLLFAGSVLAGKLKFRQASVGRDRA